MRFLLLNQTFHPDVASTAQHLTDLAVRLVERGHDVTVVTSRRAYDDPNKQFPKSETWRGIRICRIGSTGFGKSARWRRAADFGSFILLCALRLLFLPKPDAVVALTSPPLISFLGALISKLRGCRFFYWVMDFNPDEAIAAGWLRSGSPAARFLESMSRFSLKQARKIIALDRFMRDRIIAKDIPDGKVVVLPPWSHDSEVTFDLAGREAFRKAHGLESKFVVMYSGNHSPCHPLDTLLRAADQLRSDPTIVFCFIGGGSEFRKIQKRAEVVRPPSSVLSPPPPGRPAIPKHRNTETPRPSRAVAPSEGGSPLQAPPSLSSVVLVTKEDPLPSLLCLPYQPLNALSASLSAADLHVVVMGDPFVGLVHPCKIYNILNVAAPVLYIGPQVSHLSEMLGLLDGHHLCSSVRHGEVEEATRSILRLREQISETKRKVPINVSSRFSTETILPKLVSVLES